MQVTKIDNLTTIYKTGKDKGFIMTKLTNGEYIVDIFNRQYCDTVDADISLIDIIDRIDNLIK